MPAGEAELVWRELCSARAETPQASGLMTYSTMGSRVETSIEPSSKSSESNSRIMPPTRCRAAKKRHLKA